MAYSERKRIFSGSSTWDGGHWTPTQPFRDVTRETKARLNGYVPLSIPEAEALMRIPQDFPLIVGGAPKGVVRLNHKIWKDMVNAGLSADPQQAIQDVIMFEWFPGGQKGHTQEVIRLLPHGGEIYLSFNHRLLKKAASARGTEATADGMGKQLLQEIVDDYLSHRYGNGWRRKKKLILEEHKSEDLGTAVSGLKLVIDSILAIQFGLTAFASPLALPVLYGLDSEEYIYIPRSHAVISQADNLTRFSDGESSDLVFTLSQAISWM